MLNVTNRDRKTNIWIRKKTKFIDVIEQAERWMKITISRIRDNRSEPGKLTDRNDLGEDRGADGHKN